MRLEVKRFILFIVFLLSIALVIAALFSIDDIIEKGKAEDGHETETHRSATDLKNEMDTVYIDGVAYLPRKSVKNYLIIGVDEFGDSDDSGTAQADFIMVLSFNSEDNSYKLLSVNRDTMTKVDVYDIFGNKYTERVEQIALSHAYGSPFEISNSQKCKNTLKATSNLLYGLDFESYISMTMDAVSEMVDFVGGIPVLIEDDMSVIDSRLVQGETVLLDGELALKYIRARGSMADSSNLARMERQKIFLEAFIQKLGEKKPDEDDLLQCYQSISSYIVTDSGIEVLEDITDKLSDYTYDGAVAIPGEARSGEVYMEFYVDEEGMKGVVTDVFYTKAK